jgi:hypothetical protein
MLKEENQEIKRFINSDSKQDQEILNNKKINDILCSFLHKNYKDTNIASKIKEKMQCYDLDGLEKYLNTIDPIAIRSTSLKNSY